MKKKRFTKALKTMICSLPLAGAVATTFLPLRPIIQQFTVLIVLLWVQVFFVFEIFLAPR